MMIGLLKTVAAAACDESKEVCLAPLPNITPGTDNVQNVLSFIYMLTTILSVIFVIIGAIKYIVSAGDASAVQSAKNTIMYALIGLAVTLSAFAITNFVIGRI